MKTLIRRMARKLEARSGARFIVAGGVNTVFGFLVYGAVLLAGGPVWVALLTSVLAGVLFNYVTIGGYAFRQLSRKTFPRFVSCYALVFAINLLSIRLLEVAGIGAVGAQALLTLPMAVLSFLLMRHIAFPAR